MTAAVPTIYIIDDDDGMRRALSLLLSTVGYQTESFASSDAFLQRFDPDRHGCLILDIRMPGMSGLELQQHLNKTGSMLPLIFITGHGDVPMAVQAMKEGAFEFIQKPFRDQDLLASRRCGAAPRVPDPARATGAGDGGGRRRQQGDRDRLELERTHRRNPPRQGDGEDGGPFGGPPRQVTAQPDRCERQAAKLERSGGLKGV
jgi:DNA-binding response OmpR family regulator